MWVCGYIQRGGDAHTGAPSATRSLKTASVKFGDVPRSIGDDVNDARNRRDMQ